jgi:chloramphenicol 3-O-phosphotransferase
MMTQPAPIFLLSGLPAAGKSSVARALMARFPYGLHLSVDSLRTWVVSGYARATPVLSPEARRQFAVARRSAARIAREYADAGFAVAVDDVLSPGDARDLFVTPFAGYTIHKVLLRPSLDEALRRNAARAKTSFDTAYLAETILALDRRMDAQEYAADGWLVIDTTTLTVEATVDAVIAETRG